MYFTVFIVQCCFFVYASLNPYIFKELEIDTLTMSSINSGVALLQVFTSPLIGRLGDRYGARNLLIISVISSVSGQMVAFLATGISMLLLSKLLFVAQDVKLGAQMLTSDLVDGKDRGPAMGRIMVPFSLGLLAGPLIAGQSAKYLGNQWTLLAMATWTSSCLGIILYSVPEKTSKNNSDKQDSGSQRKTEKSTWSLVTTGRIPVLLAIKILTATASMVVAQNLVVVNMKEFGLSPARGGMVLAANGLLGVVFNVSLGKLSKRFDDDVLFKWSPAFCLLSYAIMTQASSVWILLVSFLPWNLGNVIIDAQVVARLTKSVPSSDTGSIIGINAMAFQAARIVAPLLGGCLVEVFGFSALGLFGATISSLALGLSFTF
ncbi:hypothetical protein CAPTEDRAFT_128466 [Capitella teleta]|uniref:Major facilitator superfamily (MFS) profile domain-containing protein n=1 Tax=Capitella teleta TaxID=283909 RepID=R7TBV5_CAPTE|nr:hypothetical protein CAPTEDRAFT_128466 [Capitella teleta]|eukprot:ELT91203.1 hypothetical protein CAPTEDRAFT_128466 [Capitella teleta]